MAQRIHIGVHIALTALACVSSISLLCAGRSGYHILILMGVTHRRQVVGLIMVTALTVTALLSAVVFTGLGFYIPFSEIMAQGIDNIYRTDIATLRTGTGSITVLSTGRLSDYIRIAVAGSRNHILELQYRFAHFTVTAISQAICGTAGRITRYNNLSMASGS
jgi:hypothetical protein